MSACVWVDACVREVHVGVMCESDVSSDTLCPACCRYRPLLLELVQSDGAKVVCVKAVAEYFQLKPLWLQLVLSKLIRMQVIDPSSVVSFVFLPEAVDVLTR